ncbi:hypothetical protein KEM48_012309 [Puccinia striiformis f. sp. tritici PST-130]|nr:hypothetical protein KEM48_012309 [Puccinia striiformis f. sp. tritici PST-130]
MCDRTTNNPSEDRDHGDIMEVNTLITAHQPDCRGKDIGGMTAKNGACCSTFDDTGSRKTSIKGLANRDHSSRCFKTQDRGISYVPVGSSITGYTHQSTRFKSYLRQSPRKSWSDSNECNALLNLI